MQKPPIGQLIKPPIGAGRRNREKLSRVTNREKLSRVTNRQKLSRVTNREMAIKPPIGQLSHQ